MHTNYEPVQANGSIPFEVRAAQAVADAALSGEPNPLIDYQK